MCEWCGAELAAIPAIDISKLARLDELAGAPATDRARAAAGGLGPFAPPPDAFAPPREAHAVRTPGPPAGAARVFEPPAEDPESADQVLEVERSTRAIRLEQRYRDAQAASPPAASPPSPAASPTPLAAPPQRPIRGVVLAVLLIAAVAIGVAALAAHRGNSQPLRGGGVSIRIIARQPTDVFLDGQRAGKTPLTLQRPKATEPILITTAEATRQIIPDRDQVIDVSP